MSLEQFLRLTCGFLNTFSPIIVAFPGEPVCRAPHTGFLDRFFQVCLLLIAPGISYLLGRSFTLFLSLFGD